MAVAKADRGRSASVRARPRDPDSPRYRIASEDLEFLASDDTRGVRLQMDYLKPELLLRKSRRPYDRRLWQHANLRTFRRAPERRGAWRALALDPSNTELARRLAIAERVLANSQYYDVAREFGKLIGEVNRADEKSQTLIMTGGGPGIMEAANRGAFDAGAKTVGLNIHLPQEQFPNPYVTTDLCFRFHYFALRKLHFLQRARALVSFPGGYGTFDELFEILTLIQTRTIKPIPVVLVGEPFWRRAFDLDFLVDEGVIDFEDRDLFWFAETAQDIWDSVQNWERANSERFGANLR